LFIQTVYLLREDSVVAFWLPAASAVCREAGGSSGHGGKGGRMEVWSVYELGG
jgi:hypothetical protein